MNPPVEDDRAAESEDAVYHLKWMPWNSGKIPIVMQSKNGPCPLIATINVLLLREKVKLPDMLEQITTNQLLTYLGECIMDCVPSGELENDEGSILNLEQNIHDAIEILPKLKTGLDVNIRFTGITDFEYTNECIIFDLLRIPLYHGWLIDPVHVELQNAIGKQSYNQLVDNIITNKFSTDAEAMAKVLIAEEFLQQTASQLTNHGLSELKTQIKDNEIGILFRNNHFLTLFKREGEIYTLVTDHGYLTEDNIIWEVLDSIEGAGKFYDSNFTPSDVASLQKSEREFNAREQQVVNDYMIALSLKEEEQALAAGQSSTSQALDCSQLFDRDDDIQNLNRDLPKDSGQSAGSLTTIHEDTALSQPDNVESTQIKDNADIQEVAKQAPSTLPTLDEENFPPLGQQPQNQHPQNQQQSTEGATSLPASSSNRRQRSERNGRETSCIVN